ncbi:MAG: hypothetical protein KIT80_15275 [Chitinophagaceae bacterium]|nr:hypothetical protein [Chitinophagaceae bacterium]MCW5928276.1 hypothetical protein [Chitinophagaceae bacterium]
MLRAPHLRDYSDIIKKTHYLIYSLRVEVQRYNMAAEAVNHRQLRDSIRYLAQQNDHYANELQSQLYMIGAQVNSDTMNADDPGKIQYPVAETGNHPLNPAWDDIIRRCCDSEKDIITAYRNILNGSLPEELRSVLHYQLEGMLSGFLQIKLVRNTLDPT